IPTIEKNSNILSTAAKQNQTIDFITYRAEVLYEGQVLPCELLQEEVCEPDLHVSSEQLASNLELERLRNENENLKNVNSNLRNKLNELNNQNNLCKAEIAALKAEMENKIDSNLGFEELVTQMKFYLKGTLSDNQKDLILQKKKRMIWTDEELSAAFTLRYFSKKAYNYLAKDLKYPLPSIATLKRYAKRLNIKEGILDDVLKVVGNITKTFTLRDRECVLSFDEMKVSKILEYDPVSDEVIGPYNYLQVVMARGLFKNWKQPVFIGFDQKMTKVIIMTIIAKLAEHNINVTAIRYYPENEDARRLAHLIEKIDLWFSVSNTYTPTAKLDYKKSYTGSDDQLNALMDMFEFTSNMVPCGKNKIQVFQKSILMQINSLEMLFDEMKSKYGQKVKFISTHKLNQDVLENFFSQLRQKGGVYDHPSPLSCIYRIRLMILGKSPTILRNQTNVGPSNPKPQDEYISSQSENQPADHESNYIRDQNEPIISSRILTQADITPTLPNIEDVQKENGITTQDNSDTFSTVSSSDLKLPEQDGDGLQHIMGYIAKTYHKKIPELKLGEFTFKMTTDHRYSNPPSFVQHLSVGGLFAPSESFLKQGNKMEKIFLKFNREGSICKKKGIATRLTKP
uniref:Uncharacterized protein n=1 Tax=Anopheles arabiensis TaxID=7173 RepID=A0A182IDI7_ANOAR